MSLSVEVYSEKAIVLRGASDGHKTILEANKGMFNARLKGGAGWIFPKYLKSQIETLVEQINSGVDLSPPASKSSNTEHKECEVSKKEYLALVSRVERLEALVAQLTRGSSVPSSVSYSASSSVSPKAVPPTLDNLPVEDLDIDFEDTEEEPVKKLSKPKKAAPTVESVTTTNRRSFSKPKVNP
jgi:hypothetical protein